MATVVSADWVLPVEGDPIPDGAVAFEDGRILAVGPASELGRGTRYEGAVIVPGLVNAHTHLEYAVYAGFADGQPFDRWIGTHIRRKALLADDDHLAIARLGAAESLASGVTTVGDASYTGAAAQAAAELGLRATIHLEVFGASVEQALARFAVLRTRADPHSSDRVRLGVSPHAPYTVSEEVYAAVAALGLPVMTHLHETGAERAWVERGAGPWAETMGDKLVAPAGRSGIRMLAERGLLSPRLAAIHCVDLADDELAVLAEQRTSVVHCPRSNGYLGCGIAPLRALLDAGVRVGLGTDSPNSAGDFDLFAELRAAVLHARARERDPAALGATEALERRDARRRPRAGPRRGGRLPRPGQARRPRDRRTRGHRAPSVGRSRERGRPRWQPGACPGYAGRRRDPLREGKRGVAKAKPSQRSRRRTKANARRRVRGNAGISQESLSSQDQMFFMRLRNHAKWVFVLLAIVFVFSFTVAGVGSGSTGIGDLFGSVSLFGGGTSSSNPVKAAQKQLDKAGKDTAKRAVALRALADAQARKSLTADAEATYVRYLALRPNDAVARQQLGSLYANDANTQAGQLQPILSDVVQSTPSGPKFVTDPIQAAVHQDAVSRATERYRAFSAAARKELGTLALAAAGGKGSQHALTLGQLAQDGTGAVSAAQSFAVYVAESPAAATAQQDVGTFAAQALTAWKTLLKLNQDNAGAKTQIQQRIKELEPYAPAAASSSAG